jgi:hypothetical protein
MKKLIFIFILFSFAAQAQTEDNAINLVNDTTEIELSEIVNSTDFALLDTIQFNSSGDAESWELTEWFIKSETVINPTTRRVRYVQYKINGQGVRQKRIMVIKYTKQTNIQRKIK